MHFHKGNNQSLGDSSLAYMQEHITLIAIINENVTAFVLQTLVVDFEWLVYSLHLAAV